MPPFSLFPDEAAGQPHPVWEIVEAARRERVTGEVTFGTDPLARMHLLDGVPYMAERATDPKLGIRLMVEGVLTRAQLSQGAVVMHGVQDLGHLFERDDGIDRGPVEVAIERITDELLAAIADQVVPYDVRPLHHHPSGIVRWWRPVVTSSDPVSIVEPPATLVEAALAESGADSVAESVAAGIRHAIETIDAARQPVDGVSPADLIGFSGGLVSADLVAPAGGEERP